MSDGPDPSGGFPVTPPPLRRPVLFDQTWVDLTFIHWPVHPDAVAHLYPPGARPDVFADGLTYVALVPFRMGHTALGTGPRLPYFGVFAETNVRLYPSTTPAATVCCSARWRPRGWPWCR